VGIGPRSIVPELESSDERTMWNEAAAFLTRVLNVNVTRVVVLVVVMVAPFSYVKPIMTVPVLLTEAVQTFEPVNEEPSVKLVRLTETGVYVTLTCHAKTFVSSLTVRGMVKLAPLPRQVPDLVGRVKLVVCANRNGYVNSIDARPTVAIIRAIILVFMFQQG